MFVIFFIKGQIDIAKATCTLNVFGADAHISVQIQNVFQFCVHHFITAKHFKKTLKKLH